MSEQNEVSGKDAILVVEDEETVRQLLTLVLRREGYRVITAASAEEALQVSAENPGELKALITDMKLPGTSGADLARELRRTKPSLPIIVVSGRDTATVKEEFEGMSGVQSLSKPYTIANLWSAIHFALEQRIAP